MFTLTKINENQFRLLDQSNDILNAEIMTKTHADRTMTELELFRFFKASDLDCLDLWDAMEAMQVGAMTYASFSIDGRLVYCK